MKRPTRVPLQLSESLHKRLRAYTLAASAAGVGVLALAQPAEARIEYTPADEWLPINQTFYLDLNHDGVDDFRFRLVSTSTSMGIYARNLAVLNAESNQLRNGVYSVSSQNTVCASALPKGIGVGRKSPFTSGGFMFEKSHLSTTQNSICPWLRVKKHAYLGLRFTINGQVHYGWARLGYISANHPAKAKLTGYAYETIPNKPIIAGKTHGKDEATLGRLAQGASVVRQKQ